MEILSSIRYCILWEVDNPMNHIILPILLLITLGWEDVCTIFLRMWQERMPQGLKLRQMNAESTVPELVIVDSQPNRKDLIVKTIQIHLVYITVLIIPSILADRLVINFPILRELRPPRSWWVAPNCENCKDFRTLKQYIFSTIQVIPPSSVQTTTPKLEV